LKRYLKAKKKNTFKKMKSKIASMGAIKIQWANNITLHKDLIYFCPKLTFSYEWIFYLNLLQIVIKKMLIVVPIYDRFFCLSFFNEYDFFNIQNPCRFCVVSLKWKTNQIITKYSFFTIFFYFYNMLQLFF
jgi:hypothetical protein